MQSVLREPSGVGPAENSFNEDLDSQLLLDARLEPLEFDDRFSPGTSEN
jgi:hypothetical protein